MSIFQARKGIHVELDRDIHAALRAKLFSVGLSMQQVFEEFARRLVAGDSRADRIVGGLIEQRVKEAIEGKSDRRTRIINPNELDQEVLYNMINETLEVADETDQ